LRKLQISTRNFGYLYIT